MAALWNHLFELVLRPLRDRGGPRSVITLQTRTAAQAVREATLRYPDMKVVSVSRASEAQATLTQSV